jgi:hypothetical protein
VSEQTMNLEIANDKMMMQVKLTENSLTKVRNIQNLELRITFCHALLGFTLLFIYPNLKDCHARLLLCQVFLFVITQGPYFV